MCCFFFFFKQKPAYEVRISDWSSDVCSSDLLVAGCADAPRTDVPLEKLVLGVKCGGSDGLSGLTANPLVGRMADAVAAAGGKVVLTEIPEIFGAEQMLMDRAVSRAVFDESVALVRDFKQYFTRHGQPVRENPSPGNIAGGIPTLEEKWTIGRAQCREGVCQYV